MVEDADGSQSTASLTVTLKPSATVSVDDAVVSGGNAFEDPSLPLSDTLTFTVSLSETNNSGSPVTVFYTLGGVAVAGTDYDTSGLTGGPVTYSVTIANGSSSATIVLPVLDDTDVEVSPETVIVTLTGTDNVSVSVGDGTGEATITDLNGSLSISDAATVTEGGGLVYTVSLTITSGSLAEGTVVVVPLTYGGTADGSDIVGGLPASIELTVDATGLFATADLTLTTVSGDGLEGDETLTVTSGGPVTVGGTNAEGITGDSGTGTITEAITVSVDDAVVSGGNAFEDPSLPLSDTLTFTVSLSETNNSGSPVTVFYTLGGVAVAGTDYDTSGLTGGPVTYSVTIANGSSSATIVLPVLDDADVEVSPETVIVTLTGTDNASVSVGDGTGEATITDLNGSLSISDAATVTEGGGLVYTVSLTITSGSLAEGTVVVVPLTYGGTADGSDIVGGLPASIELTVDATGLFATADLTLTTVSGDGLEGDETLTVTSGGPVTVGGTNAEGITGDSGTGTILNVEARILDGTLTTNTNVQEQAVVLTFFNMGNVFNSYAKLFLLNEQGQEGNVAVDAGFVIEGDQDYVVSLEHAGGSKAIVTELTLEGVEIVTTNTQLEPDGAFPPGGKQFALTSVITPDDAPTADQPATDSTDGDPTGVDSLTDAAIDPAADDVNYLFGAGGADTLTGGIDTDVLNGGAGADILNGGAGNDMLVFDRLDTTLDGGDDDDILRIDIDADGNVVNGGAIPSDSVDLTGNTAIKNIEVILLTEDASGTDGLGDPDGSGDLDVGIEVVLNAARVADFTDAGNLLYLIGSAGDTADIGSGWTFDGIDNTGVGMLFHIYTQIVESDLVFRSI